MQLVKQNAQAVAAPKEAHPLAIRIALNGNLAGLSDAQIWEYYQQMCARLDLDPLSLPFNILETKEGDQLKKTLYPNSSCSAQLGVRHRITYGPAKITPENELASLGLKVARVSVECSTADGRKLTGEAFIDLVGKYGPLAGKNLENALKKGATQARRRGTLQLCGLTMPDDDGGISGLGDIEELPEASYIESEVVSVLAPAILPAGSPDAPAPAPVEDEAAQEEARIDLALLEYCKLQKGDKNGPAFFEAQYGAKSLDQKRAIAHSLGLISAPALDAAEEAVTGASVIDEIEVLFAAMASLGKPADEISSQVARMCDGELDLTAMSPDMLARLRGGLAFWRDKTREQMAKKGAGK